MTDFSYEAAAIRDEAVRAAMGWQEAAAVAMSPSVVYRPAVYPDGNMWCALYGENLQEGVCGFGKTPALACADFDKNWRGQRLSRSQAGTADPQGKLPGDEQDPKTTNSTVSG